MPTLHDLIENFGITQPFGVEGPFGGKHTGVDIGTPSGTPVPALGEGTIENVFFDQIGGNQVQVRYDSGAQGWFAHLSDVYSHVGEHVGANTIIAASGATGEVTGPHLHYEFHDPSGALTDPLDTNVETYIGGSTSVSQIGDDCPTGYVRNIFGVCVPSKQPGFNPKNPGVDPITGAGPKAVSGGIAGPGSNLNPFDAIGKGFGDLGASVQQLGDRALTGTRQLVIAGVVIAAIAALSVAGLRRTLD